MHRNRTVSPKQHLPQTAFGGKGREFWLFPIEDGPHFFRRLHGRSGVGDGGADNHSGQRQFAQKREFGRVYSTREIDRQFDLLDQFRDLIDSFFAAESFRPFESAAVDAKRGDAEVPQPPRAFGDVRNRQAVGHHLPVVAMRGTHYPLDQLVGGVAENRDNRGAGGAGQFGDWFARVHNFDVGDNRTPSAAAAQLPDGSNAFTD